MAALSYSRLDDFIGGAPHELPEISLSPCDSAASSTSTLPQLNDKWCTSDDSSYYKEKSESLFRSTPLLPQEVSKYDANNNEINEQSYCSMHELCKICL